MGEADSTEWTSMALVLSKEAKVVLAVQMDGAVGAAHSQESWSWTRDSLDGHVQQIGGLTRLDTPSNGQSFKLLLHTLHGNILQLPLARETGREKYLLA